MVCHFLTLHPPGSPHPTLEGKRIEHCKWLQANCEESGLAFRVELVVLTLGSLFICLGLSFCMCKKVWDDECLPNRVGERLTGSDLEWAPVQGSHYPFFFPLQALVLFCTLSIELFERRNYERSGFTFLLHHILARDPAHRLTLLVPFPLLLPWWSRSCCCGYI